MEANHNLYGLIFVIQFVIEPIYLFIYFLAWFLHNKKNILKDIKDKVLLVKLYFRIQNLQIKNRSLLCKSILAFLFVFISIFFMNKLFAQPLILPVIKIDINISRILLLTIPFYYFCYRQQRTISETYLSCEQLGMDSLAKFFFVAITFIQLAQLNLDMEEDYCKMPVSYCIEMVGSVFLVISSITKLFKYLDVNVLLSDSMKKIDDILEVFNHTIKLENLIGENKSVLYRELILRIEVMYQILEYAIKKNMYTIFDVYILKLSRLLNNMNKGLLIGSFNKNVSVTESEKVYQGALKNHKMMIVSLYEKHRHSSTENALRVLYKFYPIQISGIQSKNDYNLLDQYYKTFNDILEYFVDKDRNFFQQIMDKLAEFALKDFDKKNIVVIIKSLIVLAIDNENLKFLTEICYIQKKMIASMKIKNFENNLILNNGLDLEHKMKFHASNIKKENYENYEGMALYVLMQASVKSVELGQYKITGFLVKYIVSNYDVNLIKKVHIKVCENKVKQDVKLENIALSKLIQQYFWINDATAEYCLKKFTILLLVQQHYMNNLKADGEKTNMEISLDIFKKMNDGFSLIYCMEKILEAKDNYGLLSLKKLKDDNSPFPSVKLSDLQK